MSVNSPMNVKAGGGKERQLVPAGVHNARCVSVVGIGEEETPWGPKPKVRIGWEIPGERVNWTDQDGNEHEGPAHISQFYTLSLGTSDKPSNLRELLEGWRGRPFTPEEEAGFALQNLLGKPVTLMVKHGVSKAGKKFDTVSAASRIGDDKVPPVEGDLLYYDAWDHNPEAYDKLPEWLQKLINVPGGCAGVGVDDAQGDGGGAMADDDIPFAPVGNHEVI